MKAKKHRSKAEKQADQQRKLFEIDNPLKHKCYFYDCLVPNTESIMGVHYIGKSHVGFEKLYLCTPFLEELDLFLDPSRKKYTCNECRMTGIPTDAKKLKENLLNVHFVCSEKKYTGTLKTSRA